LDPEKPGECKMDTIYQNMNDRFAAIELDPESNEYLYVLDE
jgi:hypothetical protein